MSNLGFVKTIIDGVMPSVNDMKLVHEYGLFNWIIVFLVKFVSNIIILILIAVVLWLLYKIFKAITVHVSWKKEPQKKRRRSS